MTEGNVMDWDDIIFGLLALAVWLAASIPVGIFVGKVIHYAQGGMHSPDMSAASEGR